MMRLETVSANLDASYRAFKSIIIDKNYCSKRSEISWPSYIPGISKQVYAKQYEDIINQRQFSLLLKNKAAVQSYYGYDNDGLRKIRLAYYPAPETIIVSQDEADGYLGEATTEALEVHYMLLHELIGQNVAVSNTTHLRLDFDREVSSHFKNHMQLDGVQDLRIPLKSIIAPFHFLDFIARIIFPGDYINLKDNEDYLYILSSSSKQIVVDDLKDYSSLFLSI